MGCSLYVAQVQLDADGKSLADAVQWHPKVKEISKSDRHSSSSSTECNIDPPITILAQKGTSSLNSQLS